MATPRISDCAGTTHACSHLFFAGDATSATIMQYLSTFTGEIHTVYGNNDYPHMSFIFAQKMYPTVIQHGEEMLLTIDDTELYMSHYSEKAEAAARSAGGRVCIFGHTHRPHISTLENDSILLNPGEICGKRFGTPTCAIFDIETKHATFYNPQTHTQM